MTDMALLLASFVVAVLYLCRLDGLSIRKHKTSIVLCYVFLFIAVCFSGFHAWIGTWDFQDWAILIGCVSALVVSYPTWRDGPPKWVERGK